MKCHVQLHVSIYLKGKLIAVSQSLSAAICRSLPVITLVRVSTCLVCMQIVKYMHVSSTTNCFSLLRSIQTYFRSAVPCVSERDSCRRQKGSNMSKKSWTQSKIKKKKVHTKKKSESRRIFIEVRRRGGASTQVDSFISSNISFLCVQTRKRWVKIYIMLH